MRAKRRGPKGAGTVYPRPGGRWSGQLTTADGQRKTVSGGSQADVVDKLRKLRQQLSSGLPAPDERITLAAFLEEWLAATAPRLRPSTARRYQQLVRHQIIPTWGRLRLARVRPQEVGAGLIALQQGGLSPRSCAHVRAVLRTALADAEKWGQVGRNVARLADAPRVPHEPPKMLTSDEAQAVLRAMADPGLRRLATIAVNTGLRQGELLGLSWSDMDRKGGALHLTHALQRVGGAYQLVEVKSASSRRSIPLTPAAAEALDKERRAQLEARVAAGRRWREPIPGLVFTTGTGQPRSGTAITHSYQEALTKAGLPVIRWHHLRHAFAGLLLTSGADLATVSHLLGHSSVSLTASTYAGIAPSLRADAVERLGRLLGAAKED